jgi:hypothetical protein
MRRAEEEEEEEFVMATKRLKSNKLAQLHFVQSAALNISLSIDVNSNIANERKFH